MLADAYKIASDIKIAMPDLRAAAFSWLFDVRVSSFKSKIKVSLPPLKHLLSLITQRLDNYMTNDLVKYLRSRNYTSFNDTISVNDCMIEMTKYAAAMIDNADVYTGVSVSVGGLSSHRIRRYTPPGQTRNYVYADQEIEAIIRAAVECIDIIDKRAMPK